MGSAWEKVEVDRDIYQAMVRVMRGAVGDAIRAVGGDNVFLGLRRHQSLGVVEIETEAVPLHQAVADAMEAP